MANCSQISATSQTLSYNDKVFELLLTAFPMSLVKKNMPNSKKVASAGRKWIHNVSFQDPLVWVQWDQRLWISDKSAAKVAKRTLGDKTHLIYSYPPFKNEKLPVKRFVLNCQSMDEEGLTIQGIDLFHPSTWRRRGTSRSSSSLPRCSRWRCWRTGGSQRRSCSRWSGRQGKRGWGRWVQVPARTTMWLLLVDPSKKFQLRGKQKTTKVATRRRAGKTMSKRSRNPGVVLGWEFFTFIQIRLILWTSWVSEKLMF